MKVFVVLTFFLISNLWAFPNDFKLINNRAPVEFEILFESMKNSLRDPVEQAQLVVFCNKINKGLAPLKKEQVQFLIKSEIYKTILEWKFPNENFKPSVSDIKRLKLNLESNTIYTPFARSIIESMITDTEYLYAKMERAPTENKNRVMAYTGKWLNQADNLSSADFNALVMEVSWQILQRIEKKALLVQQLSSEAIQDIREDTFNIPQLNQLPTTTKPEISQENISASEQSNEIKEQSEKEMEKINVTPSDISPEDFSSAIDNLETDTTEPSSGTGSGAQSPLK